MPESTVLDKDTITNRIMPYLCVAKRGCKRGCVSQYSFSGVMLAADAESTATLPAGFYIINAKRRLIFR